MALKPWAARELAQLEAWVMEHHPRVWEQYEYNASEWIEFDQFMEVHEYEVLAEWYETREEKADGDSM